MNVATKVGEEEWKRRLESARREGQTLAQVAAYHEIPITTVRYWKQRLSASGVGAREPERQNAGVRPPDFVKLTPKTSRAPSETEGSMLVELGEVRMHVTSTVEIPLVVALLESLKGSRGR